MASDKQSLPIDQYLPEITNKLKTGSSVVLTAAPGAGKTTRVPPGLMSLAKKKIAVLEPRRIAAVAAALRIADENQWKLGQEVGFEVRFDRNISQNTKIVFLTEALLLRKMSADRTLSEFDLIILDEFHERSIYTDVALGLVKELQMLERPDLKLVVMSATLDAQKISDFLDQAPIINVPGRLFPMKIEYDQKPQALSWSPQVTDRIIEKIKSATQVCKQDILIFLPGVFEIEQCLRKAAEMDFLKGFLLLPLHGRLSLEEQTKALRSNQVRKIIFSTNVAESAVTIDGVDCVIDGGLERASVHQYGSGFQKLSTYRISLASAHQRAGRSARQTNGYCLKLWMPHDERSFSEYALPEVKTQNLADIFLFLAVLGIQDPRSFSWFEQPAAAHIQQSMDQLKKLKLVNDYGVTELGRKVQKQPLPIRLALLFENFKANQKEELGAWVTALLSEKVKMKADSSDQSECDVISALVALNGFNRKKLEPVVRQLSPRASQYKWKDDDELILKKTLVQSFADQIGKRRTKESDRGVLASGRGVVFHPQSLVKRSPYFVALEAFDQEGSQESKISLASGLEENFLIQNFSDQLKSVDQVIWDQNKKEFYLQSEKSLWGLKLGQSTLSRVTGQYIKEHLPSVALNNFDWIVKNHEGFQSWWQRFIFYKEKVEKVELTEVEKKSLVEEALQSACMAANSLDDLLQQDLIYFFESLLDPSDQAGMKKWVPEFLVAAKDKRIKVHYVGEQAPFVEVKIQDAFVWSETPVVGKDILVTLYLLAPNMRPMQVTKDLTGFWSGSYAEIRKELKPRYPKHDWPEPRAKK